MYSIYNQVLKKYCSVFHIKNCVYEYTFLNFATQCNFQVGVNYNIQSRQKAPTFLFRMLKPVPVFIYTKNVNTFEVKEDKVATCPASSIFQYVFNEPFTFLA